MNATVKEWVQKAEEDFNIVERESRVRKHPSFNGICFHAQQCIEKLMKAWLIKKKKLPSKTHDLLILNELLIENGLLLNCSRDELRELSIGAVIFRYPGDQFDSGNYDLDTFIEVDVTVSKSAKSVFMVPLESSLYQNLVRIAKEKKITVEKGRWE